MSTEKIGELVRQGPNGKWTALLHIVYQLGGFVILAVASLYALQIVWDARERTTEQLYEEVRENKNAAYTVIRQNSESMNRLAETMDELKDEVKRRQ